MLVLSRKEGEAIRIGTDVVIEVVELRSGRVRLGITAPANVPVHRAEIVVDSTESMASPPARTFSTVIQRCRVMVPIAK